MSLSVRTFNPDFDFPAYVDLINAHNESQATEQEQRDYANLLTINLLTGRLVIDHPEQKGKIIGVCDVWQINQNPSADLMLLIDSRFRRQGLGTKLFQAALHHAKTLNAYAIDAYAQPEQKDVQAFLNHHGFELVSNCTAMEISVSQPFPRASLPENYVVRTYAELKGSEPEKLDLIVKAGNEFWGDLWGHKVTKNIELAREVMKKNVLSNYIDHAMFFLFDGETYIGHDRVNFNETPEGINRGDGGGPPGLHPNWRTPELSKEFALVGLNWLYNQGCRHIGFTSWGESEKALRKFSELGFTKNFFEYGYQLPLKDL